MRKNFKKKHPPPPRIFFLHQILFLMLEIAWNAKKTWNIEKKKLNFIFFNIKKFIKIPSISKTIQHHPHDMVHVPAKFWENTSMRFSYSAKTKRDGQTDGQMDGQTDGGALQYLPVPGLRRCGR